MKARPCTHRPCRNTTTDPTGLCFAHRGPFSEPHPNLPGPGSGLGSGAIPPPLIAGWTPGTVHPTGGYTHLDTIEEVDVDEDGVEVVVFSTRYTKDGHYHRLDGPALVAEEEGEIILEQWYVEGVEHRTDGPSEITYEGSRTSFEFRQDGKLHRLDGPAMCSTRTLEEGSGAEDGNRYYLYDTPLTPEVHARAVEALKDGAPFEWALAYAEGPTS